MRRVAAALELVGLEIAPGTVRAQLSGGQEQRVGIARAIVTDPTLLLCDEPTGDLDRKSGDEILDLLEALNDEYGKTIIMVTHDPHAAERAHRVIHLDKGTAERRAGMIGKYLPLLASSLRRKPLRTFFTIASILIAFLMFGRAAASMQFAPAVAASTSPAPTGC